MKMIKVSLAKIQYFGINETRINPFWFTTDNSINLSHKKRFSIEINPEKLSERSLLELEAAQKLGLIEIETVAI